MRGLTPGERHELGEAMKPESEFEEDDPCEDVLRELVAHGRLTYTETPDDPDHYGSYDITPAGLMALALWPVMMAVERAP